MILPTKYIPQNETMLNVGAIILEKLTYETSLSNLWEICKTFPHVGNYQRYILALDMLYMLGLINFKGNKITRIEHDI